MRKIFIFALFFLTLVVEPVAMAQDAGKKDQDLLGESMDDMLIVVGTGLAGAILGLSTLSFVDEPSDHLKNIYVGLSIGVIIGVGVVAWQQASKSKDFYNENAADLRPDFGTLGRMAWHYQNHQKYQQRTPQVDFVNYNFTF